MKQQLLSLSLLFLATISYSQEFYDLGTIQTIEISFAESNWDALLDAEKSGDENYIMAQSISINGEVFDSIGVKYKGNSTYRATQTKNPLHIELDTYKDHKYESYTDIKLSNVAKDPSFLREVISYKVLRQYMDAPLSNFANVYVNGNLIGLYSNSEAVSKKFVKNRFGSKSNTFIKCNPPAGAGPQSRDFPNLVYQGTDSTDYYAAYELKSDYGWNELIGLCDTLANNLDDIEHILDVDRALWMLAFNNVLVNLDSYNGGFAQNYYLYRDDYGRFLPVVWDLNESFGRFAMTGSGNLNDTRSKQQMSHLLHETDRDYPLISQLLGVPMYKRMYLAHVKTMLQENFVGNSLLEIGESLQTLIDADVQADGNKFFTYNNFLSNLTNDITAGGGGPNGGSTPGLTNLMIGRAEYLLGQSDFTQAEPEISNISESTNAPTINASIGITATISDAQNVLLGYRSGSDGPFQRIQMYDDGMHGDGMASDGIYGVDITISNTATEYYIYAENSGIGKFSPQRAEFEYHEISATTAAPVLGDLVINEFMASNDLTMADQDGEFDDWIELYNNGTSSISLDGHALSDDANDLAQWVFPSGTVIAPDSYLIIWADGDDLQSGLHANFRLSAVGETIFLSDASGTILDEVSYTEQITDISFSRIPNGTGDFQSSTPTFNGNNDILDCSNNGGDMDEDGICADVDCDDDDANIGAQQEVGTGCDDGDPNTINDVIQNDGCTCAGSILVETDLVINEFMANNETTITDQDGEYEDWIELYNNGSQNINLEGYSLSDNGANIAKWSFPAGTVIEANSWLIIWADEDQDQDGLHANFKLSATAETILLSDPSGDIIDEVSYVDQSVDVTHGRFPNGTGDFRNMVSTFNATNSGMSNTSELSLESALLSVFPNPAESMLTLTSNVELVNITVYDLAGNRVINNQLLTTGLNPTTIDLSYIPTGMYLLQAITKDDRIITKKFVILK